MSLIQTQIAVTTTTAQTPTVSFEDRGVAEANILTNLAGTDLTSSPKKIYPNGKSTLRVTTRRSKQNVMHVNMNLKRSEPSGSVVKDAATGDFVMQNVKNSLATLSISASLPTNLTRDPILLSNLKLALKQDGDAMIKSLIDNIDAVLIIN